MIFAGMSQSADFDLDSEEEDLDRGITSIAPRPATARSISSQLNNSATTNEVRVQLTFHYLPITLVYFDVLIRYVQ